MRTLIPALILALGLPTLAVAQSSKTLDDVTLGEHWFGPEYDKEGLKGRVVMLEAWGFN